MSRAERQLVLACVRGAIAAPPLPPVLDSSFDWQTLWRLAAEQGLAHVVARQLGDYAPPEVRKAIRAEQAAAAARATLQAEAQTRLARALADRGIAAVWLKGLVLSQELFGAPEARRSGDLDLLVAPARVPEAARVLSGLGCRRAPERFAGEHEHPVNRHHQVWVWESRPGFPIPIELHLALAGPPSCQPAAQGIIDGARQTLLAGQPLRVPGWEDELLILCLHTHQHGYALATLLDVAAYLKRFGPRLDPARLVARAKAGRCLFRLAAAVHLARLIVGGPAATFLHLLPRPRPIGSLARAFDSEAILVRHFRLACLMDSWTDALELYLPRIFPPAAYVQGLTGTRSKFRARLQYLNRVGHRLFLSRSAPLRLESRLR